jgi:tungstate transport system ATP-binding protein
MNNNAAAPLLSFAKIQKSFGARRVLDVGAFALYPGECALIIGDNGAGKTTLLKIIAGLARPDAAAEFIFNGEPRLFDKWRPAARMVYLHQVPYLFAADVRANIAYGLRRRKAADINARAAAAMKWAGIEHLAKRAAQTLSGGEARRVALARVYAIAPRLYLLDEPTAHLDEAGANAVRDLIGALAAQGAAMLISSHDREMQTLPPARPFLLREGELHPL